MADKASREQEQETLDPSLVPRSVVNFMHFGEQVNRVRGWAGLLAMFIVGYLSYRHSHSLTAATERALLAAVVAYIVFWFLWIAIAKAMRRDAIRDLTKLRDEGFPDDDGDLTQ